MQVFFVFVLLILVSYSSAQLSWLLGWDDSCADSGFKTYDLPPSKASKTLVGAGMRRKNLFVTEVDVYAVGLYLTSSKDRESGKGWTAKSLSSGGGATVSLMFARSVGTDKVVNAIVEALSGKGAAYKKELNKFKGVLLEGMGKDGAVNGDVIDFNFNGGASLEIVVRGNSVGTVKSAELKEKLMSVYVNTKKSVAPELVQCLKDRY